MLKRLLFLALIGASVTNGGCTLASCKLFVCSCPILFTVWPLFSVYMISNDFSKKFESMTSGGVTWHMSKIWPAGAKRALVLSAVLTYRSVDLQALPSKW